MTVKSRLKMAAKCLLGKEIVPKVTKHEYVLTYSDKGKFSGHTVIVTGGTGAIGSAICYELAAMGATVGVCGRSKEKIENTIQFMSRKSKEIENRLVPVVIDITNEKQIEQGIADFVEHCGKLDVMVNNAGGQPGVVGSMSKPLIEKQTSEIDLILNTNLRGTILCSKVAAQYMIKQNSGHIINMASVIGMGGKGKFSDYAATKAGIIGFTKSLALELADNHIRVNCISPGFVNQTPFDLGSQERHTNKTALKRAGYTKEIADAVSFLMEDEYITGQNIVVDGGRSLGLYGD